MGYRKTRWRGITKKHRGGERGAGTGERNRVAICREDIAI